MQCEINQRVGIGKRLRDPVK